MWSIAGGGGRGGGGGGGWDGGRGARAAAGEGAAGAFLGRRRVDEAAAGPERAELVLGAAGLADEPSVADQVDVGLVDLVRLEHRQEVVVGVVGRCLLRQQPDAMGDA